MEYLADERAGERGEGRIKALLTLFFIVIVFFSGYQFLPVYITESEFKHDVDEITRRAAANSKLTNDKILEMLEKKREEYNLPEDTSFEINRNGKKLDISVEYTVPINLIIYTYERQVKFSSSDTAL